MKIKSKFYLLALIVFIVVSVLAWFSIDLTNKSFTHVVNVFNTGNKVQNIQTDFIEPLYDTRELTLSLVIAPNKEFRKNIHKDLDKKIDFLDKKFAPLDENIKAQWQQYKILLHKAIEYVDKNFIEGAFINVTTVGRSQFKSLITSLKKTQKCNLNNSSKTFLSAKDNLQKDKIYLISGIFAIYIIVFFVGYMISKNIISSIEKVSIGLDKFFRYLHEPKISDENITIDLDTKDELGKMADSINDEIKRAKIELQNNHKFIEEITYILTQVKQDKLQNRLKIEVAKKEFITLKQVINELIDNLEYKIQSAINEKISHEKLLVQQSKLAEMGNMIGNIAHQWRQPISEVNAILLDIKLSAKHDDLDLEYLSEHIQECFSITEYMSRTISDFQNFFKPSKEKTKFSILKACKNAVTIIKSSLKFHNITLEFEDDQDEEILGYPNEFSQALLNILSNAKDILIQNKIQNPTIKLTLKKGKSYFLISIEDNGGGIKLKNIEQVFEPYFSTKNHKKGIGIGLYMTKMIIENNMNGFVNVKNSNQGAIFTIKLKH